VKLDLKAIPYELIPGHCREKPVMRELVETLEGKIPAATSPGIQKLVSIPE